jgi:hypothetical protein
VRYWQPLRDFVWGTMFRENTAQEGEVSGFLATDSVIEAADPSEPVVRGSG